MATPILPGHVHAATPTNSPAGQAVERELTIVVSRDEWVEYKGTAAQLIAEGVIPEGFEWPRADAIHCWDANGFHYWVRRTRPEGHKGPMRSWFELDNWFMRVKVTGRDWEWSCRRVIERKAQELQDEIYRQSPAGRRVQNASWRAYLKAYEDESFQAFKNLVPGLVPPKRGRKPKTTAAAEGAGHA